MEFRRLMTMQVAVKDVQKIGAVPHGTRATAVITSGHFEGARLRGKVLAGATDPRLNAAFAYLCSLQMQAYGGGY